MSIRRSEGEGGLAHEAIAVELAKRHRVVVITSGTKDLPTFEERRKVSIHRVRGYRPSESRRSHAPIPAELSAGGMARSFPAHAARAVRRVNAHFAIPSGPASLPVARLRKIPHVLSIHGGDIYILRSGFPLTVGEF